MTTVKDFMKGDNMILSRTVVYRTFAEAKNGGDILIKEGFKPLGEGVFKKDNVWFELGFNNGLNKTHTETEIIDLDEYENGEKYKK